MRNLFRGAKLARMSSGTYCIIRDLGLVKGGKGMRHHEVIVTFSLGAFGRAIGLVRRHLLTVRERRSAWLRNVPDQLGTGVAAPSMPEGASRR